VREIEREERIGLLTKLHFSIFCEANVRSFDVSVNHVQLFVKIQQTLQSLFNDSSDVKLTHGFVGDCWMGTRGEKEEDGKDERTYFRKDYSPQLRIAPLQSK
jgi:hypothetical protein